MMNFYLLDRKNIHVPGRKTKALTMPFVFVSSVVPDRHAFIIERVISEFCAKPYFSKKRPKYRKDWEDTRIHVGLDHADLTIFKFYYDEICYDILNRRYLEVTHPV